MRHTLPQNPQFYVTAPQDCPYLDNQVERKLFTALYGANSRRLNNSLSKCSEAVGAATDPGSFAHIV